jgi:N-acetylglucosaminyldiphosphoundecaprenol N-acetyl-beta-D-mannosaminyltransferase
MRNVTAPDARSRRLPTLATVDGQWINIAAEPDIVAEVRRDFRLNRGFSIHVLNLDHLVKRRADPLYRDAYERATYVTCDGAPVASLARRQFATMKRTSGPDLIEPLCRLAAAERMPVYLFGSSPETLRRAATGREVSRHRHLRHRLAVAGFRSGIG